MKKLIELFYLRYSCKKVAEKENQKNLKVIKNTLPNKSRNPESSINNHNSWKALPVICTQVIFKLSAHGFVCSDQ